MNDDKNLEVSIRSRPGGREIPIELRSLPAISRFQSAPGPGAGRYFRPRISSTVISWFQSAPGPGAGRYGAGTDHLARIGHVSIRSRPGGREIPFAGFHFDVRPLFQSAPGPGAGRYLSSRNQPPDFIRFQSAPGPGAGRYEMGSTGLLISYRFQSAPGPGAGRYWVSISCC